MPTDDHVITDRLHAGCSACGSWPTEGQRVHIHGTTVFCQAHCPACKAPEPHEWTAEPEPIAGEQKNLFEMEKPNE